MTDPPLNNPMFRPPAEAGSLVLQVDEGCPHNRCTFCGMYQATRFRSRPLEEVRRLIDHEAGHDPSARRVFLADGDVLHRPFGELEAILEQLAGRFPALARVSTYANGRSILAKRQAELERLRALKLHTLYLGLESGDEAILRQVHKGETAAAMVEAAGLAQSAGLRLSVMVLLGLGGPERSREHARATAMVLNRMQPRLLSALRVIPVPGTVLHRQVGLGEFTPLTEHQVVAELRRLIAGLELESTVFRANHTSNVVPLEGRLPRDKHALLDLLDGLLASGGLDAATPGPGPMWM